jgi:multicomponent Na+:H+ antiporter subunit C
LESLFAIVAGILVSAAVYMLLRRSIVKLIIGVSLLSYAINLIIFVAAGLTRAYAPILSPEHGDTTILFADPLPQAFILTAIVINFGVLSFVSVLLIRLYALTQSDDINK